MTDFSALKDSYLYAPTYCDIDPACKSSIWATPIARLLAAGYSFMDNCYTDDGYLFRGIESGLLQATLSETYGHFTGTREESQVERVMNIYFLTHEFSDAMTVSDLKSDNPTGGIIVIHASHFNEAVKKGNAAVMAIGDSGMVFRYPFLTTPVSLDDVVALIVTEALADKIITQKPEIQDKIINFNPGTASDCENIIKNLLKERSITPASIFPSHLKPRRIDLANEQASES